MSYDSNAQQSAIVAEAMRAAITKKTPPTVQIARVDQNGVSQWDVCLICGEAFGPDSEIFQVNDHAGRQRFPMHTVCVLTMVDRQSVEVTSETSFERYRAKLLADRKRKAAS